MAMHSITAPLSSGMERALHARSYRTAATGGEKEMVSRSTVVRVAKEEKSTEAGTRGSGQAKPSRSRGCGIGSRGSLECWLGHWGKRWR